MEHPWYKLATTTYPIHQQLHLNMNSSQSTTTTTLIYTNLSKNQQVPISIQLKHVNSTSAT